MQAGHRGWNAIDGLCRIAGYGEEERLLSQNRSLGHGEQNRSHLKTVVLLRIKTTGFGVDDQQGVRDLKVVVDEQVVGKGLRLGTPGRRRSRLQRLVTQQIQLLTHPERSSLR